MGQSKSTKTSHKTGEVKHLWIRETKVAKRCIRQHPDTPKGITKSLPNFTSLPSHDGNRYTIWWSHWQCNKFSQRGTQPCLFDLVQPTSQSPPGGSLPRHAPQIQLWCLHQSWFSWSRGLRAHTHNVDQMFTEADFERQLPNQNESRSQCQVPMTTGCKTFYSAWWSTA